jgi:hypothetical protein
MSRRSRILQSIRAKPLRSILAVLLVSWGVAEIGVRLIGAVSFPTYHVDGEIGYIPNPDQQGNFLFVHRWVFNDRSMGTDRPWNPNSEPNVLLIGNSVVMGGNPYDQKDKLGPLIQQEVGSGYAIWSIAAGGWTNVNEMVYLKRNPDVAASARFFVWEYMNGGLSGPSRWRGEYVFPREHPLCASCYVFRRYVWPRLFGGNMSELPPNGHVNPANLAEFATAVSDLSRHTASPRPGILVLYPVKADYEIARQGKEWLPERPDIEKIARTNGLDVIDIAARPEWNESLYRPDNTHPTVRGNRVLARILANAIDSGLRPSTDASTAQP